MMVTFGEALEELKKGKAIKRRDWRAKTIVFSDIGIYVTEGEMKYRWTPTQSDILAEDWSVWDGAS